MASVLKSTAITQHTGLASPGAFNVEDVQSRARKYLEQVQLEAEQILTKARSDAEQIRAEAEQQGLAEAQEKFAQQVEEEAQRLSDQRCRTAIATCETTVKELANETTNWLARWRNQTVELAAKIADKLVRRELASENELLRVWLEEALVALRDARDLRVLVHPDDFAVTGRFLQQLAKTVPQAASVEILPDPEVSQGGCIVHSNHGRIDQQLETQLNRLVEQLSSAQPEGSAIDQRS